MPIEVSERYRGSTWVSLVFKRRDTQIMESEIHQGRVDNLLLNLREIFAGEDTQTRTQDVGVFPYATAC